MIFKGRKLLKSRGILFAISIELIRTISQQGGAWQASGQRNSWQTGAWSAGAAAKGADAKRANSQANAGEYLVYLTNILSPEWYIRLQEIYVNLPPVPPPVTRDKSRPPPRPAKASIHLQQQQQTQQTQSTQQQHQPEPSTSQQARYHSQLQQQQQQPLQLQQQHFSQTDNYVGLSLIPNIVDLPGATAACTTPSRNAQAHNQLLVSDVLSSPQQQQQQHHSRFHHAQQPPQQQQHQSSSPARRARAPTNAITSATTNMPSTSSITQHPPTHTEHPADIDELVDYADVADSIRDYNIAATSATATSASVVDAAATSLQKQRSPSHENLLRTEPKFQKLSPEKYDQLVGNFGLGSVSGLGSGSVSGSGSAKAAERHMQQHADDIELYVDPCDYASLREIGLPLEEIQEISKKLKQEQKDEVPVFVLNESRIPGNQVGLSFSCWLAVCRPLSRRTVCVRSTGIACWPLRHRTRNSPKCCRTG